MFDILKYTIVDLVISHRFDAKIPLTTVFMQGFEVPILTFNLQGEVLDRNNKKIGKIQDTIVNGESCFVYKDNEETKVLKGIELTNRYASLLTEGLVAKDYVRENYEVLKALCVVNCK